ncbi:zwei Ig domain protein zig-1-like [Acyrthosiphon pisum]|uniref:Ig-like domain-containing protein n=1 Tax=Acyrthosiphon pisum TaxID=7029 RepID=A0A8R2NVL2_ACYPI|nr:zwei Ig domain protein zig-1-like [Acyrthosiphon pisum]
MILIKHFSGAVPVRVNISLPTTMIAVGSDLTIPCSVDGYPIPTVTWYKDGQILRNNERTQATENKLVVVRTNASDSGSYKCEAYNSYSSDEKTVNITIEGAYSIIILIYSFKQYNT